MEDQIPQTDIHARLAASLNRPGAVEQPVLESGGVKPASHVSVRRFFAFIIDCALFTALGKIIVFAGGMKLLPLGEDGWWVALAIAAVYFSILESQVGKGQSFGKKLTKIEVRHISGSGLSIVEAFARFLLIGLAAAIVFHTRYLNPASEFFTSFVVLGVFIIISIVAFALFHPQRLSVPDILSKSVVVLKGREFTPKKASLERPFVLFIVLSLLFSGMFLETYWILMHTNLGKYSASACGAIQNNPDVKNSIAWVDLMKGDDGKYVQSLFISAYVPDFKKFANPSNAALVAQGIKNALPAEISMSTDIKQVVVELRGGYDIGIWKNILTSTHKFFAGRTADDAPKIRIKATDGPSRKTVTKPAPKPTPKPK